MTPETRARRPATRPRAVARAAVVLALVLPLTAPLLAREHGPGEGSVAPHTELRESRPAADTVIDEVREVLLVYTTPVQVALSRITVLDGEGLAVPSSGVEHPTPTRTDRLVVRFDEPLPPGDYRVRWSTAGPDGHVLADSLAFRVAGAQAEPAPAEPAPAEPAPAEARDEGASPLPFGAVPSGTGQRWLHLFGTILLVGVVTFRFAVLGRAARKGGLDAVVDRAGRRLAQLAWVAAGVLAVTLVTRLLGYLAALGAGQGIAWELLPHTVFRTAWGGGWGLHLAAIALAVIGLAIARRPGAGPRGWGIVAGAAVLLPLVPALQGHAMAADARTVTIPLMYVHVGAASAWLGGLLMLVLAGIPAAKRFPASEGSVPPLARLVEAFSRVALVCVGTLVTAGIATVVLYGIGVGDLLGTAWGRTLLVKLLVVAAALLLGYHNWRRVRPTLRANPDPGALRIPATVEAILGLVVLLVTAALVATALP